jgi:hypothetical protein
MVTQLGFSKKLGQVSVRWCDASAAFLPQPAWQHVAGEDDVPTTLPPPSSHARHTRTLRSRGPAVAATRSWAAPWRSRPTSPWPPLTRWTRRSRPSLSAHTGEGGGCGVCVAAGCQVAAPCVEEPWLGQQCSTPHHTTSHFNRITPGVPRTSFSPTLTSCTRRLPC